MVNENLSRHDLSCLVALMYLLRGFNASMQGYSGHNRHDARCWWARCACAEKKYTWSWDKI